MSQDKAGINYLYIVQPYFIYGEPIDLQAETELHIFSKADKGFQEYVKYRVPRRHFFSNPLRHR